MKMILVGIFILFQISCGESKSVNTNVTVRSNGSGNQQKMECLALDLLEAGEVSTSEQSVLLTLFRALQSRPGYSMERLQDCLEQVYYIHCEGHQCVVRGK